MSRGVHRDVGSQVGKTGIDKLNLVPDQFFTQRMVLCANKWL
jgi:hypothetical protein